MPEKTSTTCPHCGSDKIVADVRLSMTAEVGNIGPTFRAVAFLMGTEPLLLELCDQCGTVVRLYVKEVGKRWVTG